MSTTLTAPERSDLRRLEGIIEKGMLTFIEVGSALKQIRDDRLYREKWKTFEAYCDDRFEFGRGYANKLITAASTALAVSKMGTIVPKTESQARELAKVPEEDWQDVIDEVAEKQAETGEPATAKTYKEAAEKVATREPGEKKPPKSGSEKLSPAKVIDGFYKAHFPNMVRGLDKAAEAIGKKGPNYTAANKALNTFSERVKEMREGKA